MSPHWRRNPKLVGSTVALKPWCQAPRGQQLPLSPSGVSDLGAACSLASNDLKNGHLLMGKDGEIIYRIY